MRSGQWLRRKHLGIEQERLSPELLQELSRKSLKIHLPANDKASWVSTGLDALISDAVQEQDLAFVVAESDAINDWNNTLQPAVSVLS